MRWIKLSLALLSAKRKSKLQITDESTIDFTVWPTDIDVSIMNHAAIMTVMEMGRIDFIVRSGFLKLARQKKWYFPSASVSAQFIRPLKMFQRATVRTRVFHMSDKWIYIEQKVERAGKVMAICLVKSTVKKGREFVNTKEIVEALQLGKLPSEGNELVEAYEKESLLLSKKLIP